MSVIINGSGISGVILALILSKLSKGNLDINVVEFCLHSGCSSFASSRGIALSRNTYYKLMSCGILPFLSSCSIPIKQIEIIDLTSNYNDRHNKIIISSCDYHISELGYVIELHNIKTKIFNFLKQSSYIRLFYPAKLKRVQREQSHCTVILDNGIKISSRLLIAADGSYSRLATLCGMNWYHLDYNQVAVITNITTSLKNNGRAFEVFTAHGSLALLPMSDNRSSLIWCVPFKDKNEIFFWNTLEFCKKLQTIFGWKLGYIQDADQRYFYSLFLRKSKRHISHRLALVGNAAQTLHPIAGQGFNLAVRDITHISEIIAQAKMNNIDIGDYSILRLYQSNRESDQSYIIGITHFLTQLFNTQYFPMMFARRCGFSIIRRSVLFRDFLGKFLFSL